MSIIVIILTGRRLIGHVEHVVEDGEKSDRSLDRHVVVDAHFAYRIGSFDQFGPSERVGAHAEYFENLQAVLAHIRVLGAARKALVGVRVESGEAASRVHEFVGFF